MATPKLDDTDLKILRILQAEPDLPVQEVGARVGLSHTPAWRRIRKMQDSGIIAGRALLLDAEKVGMDISVFVFVRLEKHSPGVLEAFEEGARAVPEILQCYAMSGDFDFLLRVVVPSVRDYERAVKAKLLRLPNVGTLNSHFALSEVKNSTALPI